VFAVAVVALEALKPPHPGSASREAKALPQADVGRLTRRAVRLARIGAKVADGLWADRDRLRGAGDRETMSGMGKST
jgi:hypothetical protein